MLRKVFTGVAVNWLAKVFTIAANLVLIPIYYKFFGKKDLGVWFLMVQNLSLYILLDFGLNATLQRRFAFLAAEPDGTGPLDRFYNQTKRPFRIISVASFFLLYLVGIGILGPLANPQVVHVIWPLFALGGSLQLWAWQEHNYMIGTGQVARSNSINLIFSALNLLTQIAIMKSGGGLLHLALGVLACSLIFKLMSRSAIKVPRSESGRLENKEFQELLHVSFKAWVTAISAFVILRTDQFFIAYFLGTESVADYQSTYQVISSLYAIAVSICISANFYFGQLWGGKRFEELRKNVLLLTSLSMIIMIVGSVFYSMNAETVMFLWLGQGHYIGEAVTAVLLLTLFLECHHVCWSVASRATENEKFVVPALSSAVLNLVLSYFLGKRYGIPGIASATLLSQMLTNNWYVVYESLRRLQVSARSFFAVVLKDYVPVLLLAIGVNALGNHLFTGPMAVAFNFTVSSFLIVVRCYFIYEGIRSVQPPMISRTSA